MIALPILMVFGFGCSTESKDDSAIETVVDTGEVAEPTSEPEESEPLPQPEETEAVDCSEALTLSPEYPAVNIWKNGTDSGSRPWNVPGMYFLVLICR